MGNGFGTASELSTRNESGSIIMATTPSLRERRKRIDCSTSVFCLVPDFAGPTSRDHRAQRVDNRRNSARFPLYLAAGRVLSNPPIIVAPQRSQIRHSHLVGLRLVINTSNTARSRIPS